MLFAPLLVNQRFPSGPLVIPLGCRIPLPTLVWFVTAPAVVTLPMELPSTLVNHRLPSGPAVIARGMTMPVPEYGVTTPAGVIRPTEASR